MLGATTKGVALPGRAELSRTTWDSGSGVAKQNVASAAESDSQCLVLQENF